MPGELEGQVALVTGGGRGIGRAIGRALAAEAGPMVYEREGARPEGFLAI